jgi:hypothetical protein
VRCRTPRVVPSYGEAPTTPDRFCLPFQRIAWRRRCHCLPPQNYELATSSRRAEPSRVESNRAERHFQASLSLAASGEPPPQTAAQVPATCPRWQRSTDIRRRNTEATKNGQRNGTKPVIRSRVPPLGAATFDGGAARGEVTSVERTAVVTARWQRLPGGPPTARRTKKHLARIMGLVATGEHRVLVERTARHRVAVDR